METLTDMIMPVFFIQKHLLEFTHGLFGTHKIIFIGAQDLKGVLFEEIFFN